MRTQLLDPIPVLGVFLLFAIITLGFYEIGFRVGRWWQDRLPGEQEGPTDMLVGSLLALMAFLLAITMGMAADRFDARRGLVLEEANAIQAVYLQAGYLPPAQTDQMRELVREYSTLRIATSDQARVLENARDLRVACTQTCGRSWKRSSRPGTTPTSCRRSATR